MKENCVYDLLPEIFSKRELKTIALTEEMLSNSCGLISGRISNNYDFGGGMLLIDRPNGITTLAIKTIEKAGYCARLPVYAFIEQTYTPAPRWPEGLYTFYTTDTFQRRMRDDYGPTPQITFEKILRWFLKPTTPGTMYYTFPMDPVTKLYYLEKVTVPNPVDTEVNTEETSIAV